MEQVFISHHHKLSEKICNCTMCPEFFPHGAYSNVISTNHCRYLDGRIPEPEISWCTTGLALIWMTTHKPGEVVDLLVKFEKRKG